MLGFQFRHQDIVLVVLGNHRAELLIRLYQMCFDFFLFVPFHAGHLSFSGVATPARFSEPPAFGWVASHRHFVDCDQGFFLLRPLTPRTLA